MPCENLQGRIPPESQTNRKLADSNGPRPTRTRFGRNRFVDSAEVVAVLVNVSKSARCRHSTACPITPANLPG